MARRTQSTYNPPRADLDPVAAPASRPFVPSLPQPALAPVEELAGLSQILQKISVQQAERRNEVAKQQGLDAAAAAPADQVAALAQAHRELDAADGAQRGNQEQFAKAQKAGKIGVEQNPWHDVGWKQGMAHRIMAGYDAKLADAMLKATATTDANGDPVVAQSPDAVIAEVWGQYKDNPLLKDYYGSKVAQKMKADADARFTATASKTLAENKVRDTVTWATNSLADKMYGVGVSGEAPTAETWTQVRDWADELYLKTGGRADRRAIMLDALKGAASRMDQADHGESGVSKAADLIRSFADAPLGTTTVGKDAVAAPELESLIDHYEAQQKQRAENLGRAEANEDARAVNTAEREAFALLDKVRADGGPVDVAAVVERYAAQVRESGQFGPRTGLVVDALQKLTLESSGRGGSIMAAELLKNLDAGDDPDSIAYAARAGRSELGLQGYRAVIDAVEQRKSVAPLIEKSPLSLATHKDLEDATELVGIPPAFRGEVGARVQADHRALLADFNRREVAAMGEILKLPEEQQEAAQREWHETNGAALAQTIRERVLQLGKDRAAARAKVVDLLQHSQSPESALQEFGDLFAAEEAEQFRAAAVNATDTEAMTRGPEFESGEALVIGKVRQQFKDDPDLLDIEAASSRELRAQFRQTIGGALAGVDPAKRGETIRLTAEALADSVIERATTSRRARFSEAVQEGEEGIPSAKALLDAGAQDLSNAKDAIGTTDRGEAAKALVTQNPNVPQGIVDYQSAFLRATTSPGFGSQLPAFGLFQTVTRDDVENLVEVEGLAVASNPRLSPVERGQALADMKKVTGIPAQDLLDGVLRLTPSAGWRAKAEQHLARLQGIDDPRFEAQRRVIRAELEKTPTEFPLEGVTVGPYTTPFFSTEAELRLWTETREADLRALARKYGVPDSSPESGDRPFKEFIRFQIEAIKRLQETQ